MPTTILNAPETKTSFSYHDKKMITGILQCLFCGAYFMPKKRYRGTSCCQNLCASRLYYYRKHNFHTPYENGSILRDMCVEKTVQEQGSEITPSMTVVPPTEKTVQLSAEQNKQSTKVPIVKPLFSQENEQLLKKLTTK